MLEQSAPKFGNLPLQAKERALVNRKLITALHWHQNQNSELSSCAERVLHRQTNCHYKAFKSLNQWSSTFFAQSPPYRNFASKSPPTYDFSVGKNIILIWKYFNANEI